MTREEAMLHRVYLGLGSNLGDRESLLRRAIELIGERVGKVVRCSSLIETEPWGFESQHPFLNGVVLCQTALTPRQLLEATQRIERLLGKTREHATRRTAHCPQLSAHCYKDRPIDIDILLYDEATVDEPDLKIPHPLMHERPFVMIPLNELINNN